MERYMGLDIGTKTIGVALSDPLFTFASGLKTIKRTGSAQDIKELIEIIGKNLVTKIVVGMPYNMNKTIGPQGQRVLSFVDLLKKETDKEIILVDERLTTVSAERVLMESGVRREKRKDYVDKIAATFILQSYLDTR
ncbi:Holliday junction resolvase RuvX [Peptoniphilaceae bacterium SGI.131]